MIQGLQNFIDYFRDDYDKYILIGGAATILTLSALGSSRRKGTKDLDLVFVVEVIDSRFLDKFMDYVQNGGYTAKASQGKSQFFRFENPINETFPKMIEILSRKPDLFQNVMLSRATKLSVSDEVSSLSALILDDAYYRYIVSHCTLQGEIQVANIECLILLKIRAYNDLKLKKDQGDPQIKREDINKHRNDVFRLAENLASTDRFDCPPKMKEDILLFQTNMQSEEVDSRNLHLSGTKEELMEMILGAFDIINMN
ncbi:MAG: hypothetical protein PHP32_00620 [Candidatus Izemoplasmatales bacterium]|nr:hypothetical protein [Candidatus Izemoplasmatales bacterium]